MSEICLALPHVHIQYRNLNLFPFPSRPIRTWVRTDLLFADEHCEETLGLPELRILTVYRSYYYQDFHPNAVH